MSEYNPKGIHEIDLTIDDVAVYGLDESIRRAKYPMAVNVASLNGELTKGIANLAKCEKGTGHDQWLEGVIVQFDLTYTVKAWVEAERYTWFRFISSQSTMHRIAKFDLDGQYIQYVDPRMIEIMKEKVDDYNRLVNEKHFAGASEEDIREYQDLLAKKYLEILYSNPCGFRLTAGMTTNYRQLKTIYAQRRTHRLPEWVAFCRWIEALPHSELITGKEMTA